ncbi:MAG: hypothetical protein COX51_07415 [Syntrophobacteraceae bacterium CG23_combo_of_CG06-09_8_20_14_all_50_8]|nr:MAG: hypothetical protein COX51_07415 [Syntrophobacteraceae bacterium CG23_combo_of_CG06-09_8_20_14_all_50_8]
MEKAVEGKKLSGKIPMAKPKIEQTEQGALDETLYEARRVRGILRVLADVDENCIASYGYHELLAMAYLTQDALDKALDCLDKDVIGGLLSAGATDSMIEAIQEREE